MPLKSEPFIASGSRLWSPACISATKTGLFCLMADPESDGE